MKKKMTDSAHVEDVDGWVVIIKSESICSKTDFPYYLVRLTSTENQTTFE